MEIDKKSFKGSVTPITRNRQMDNLMEEKMRKKHLYQVQIEESSVEGANTHELDFHKVNKDIKKNLKKLNVRNKISGSIIDVQNDWIED